MNFLNKLERSCGWIAIGHLPIYVVTAQVILYVWTLLNPDQAHLLAMDPYFVFQRHEVWRILTFLFLSPFQNPIWAFFYLYFQYLCGVTLEQEWGSFRLTLFYLTGGLGAIAAAFLAGEQMRDAFYLNETIFLAFAALYPDFKILLFFILPLKIRWLAWFTWARIALGLYWSPPLYRWAILLSLTHYFLFFGKSHYDDAKALVERYRHRRRFKDFSGQ